MGRKPEVTKVALAQCVVLFSSWSKSLWDRWVLSFVIINSLGGELHIGRPGVTAPVSISPTLLRMTTRIHTECIAQGGVEAEKLTQPKSIAFAFPDLFKEMQLQILEIE